MNSIHDYDSRVSGSFRRLESAPIMSVNKNYFLKFIDYLRAMGMSKARIDRYQQVLKLFGLMISKDFKELTKDDYISIVGSIEARNYKDWTKITYKRILKKFVSWLYGGEVDPDCIKWIKFNYKTAKRLPEEILTQDEVKRLIEAAIKPRDKALIACLYESGCRIGELGDMKLKHVQFDNYGAKLLVKGKTGQRRVRIISSVSYLARWINEHPQKNDPEAPLWISFTDHQQMLNYCLIRQKLVRLALKAGITKKVNPHSFRHARATHLCSHLTEAQMKEYFGWVQGSKMASVYIHLSGRDVDRALLKVNGIKINEEDDNESLGAVNCARCQENNEPTNTYCKRCGMILDTKKLMNIEQEERNKNYLLNELIKDPQIKGLLQQKAQVILRTQK